MNVVSIVPKYLLWVEVCWLHRSWHKGPYKDLKLRERTFIYFEKSLTFYFFWLSFYHEWKVRVTVRPIVLHSCSRLKETRTVTRIVLLSKVVGCVVWLGFTDVFTPRIRIILLRMGSVEDADRITDWRISGLCFTDNLLEIL